MTDPLDRPVWFALAGRQAGFALGDDRARRYRPTVGLFAAADEGQGGALAALVGPGETLALFEAGEVAVPDGLRFVSQADCDQMLWDGLGRSVVETDWQPLGDADAPEMVALAALTRPGPFFADTHHLGPFIGVRRGGALVAMAGERMKLPGHSEVSGVCTHSDFRGRGLAGALIVAKANAIAARGETPFLHSYTANTSAVALYEALGFRFRRRLMLTMVERRQHRFGGRRRSCYGSPMRLEPAFQPITVDQFLAMDFGSDRKFELVDGVIRMMTGGTSTHALVAGNIFFYLRLKLRGSGCRPYGSDMAVRVDDENLRYPDVSVFCGNPASADKPEVLAFDNPTVLFEVLSPSTSGFDQGRKLAEYRALASVETIVLVDTQSELCRVHQRLGPASWRDDMFAQPHDIELPSLGIVLPHAEIFARD